MPFISLTMKYSWDIEKAKKRTTELEGEREGERELEGDEGSNRKQ